MSAKKERYNNASVMNGIHKLHYNLFHLNGVFNSIPKVGSSYGQYYGAPNATKFFKVLFNKKTLKKLFFP